MSGYGTTLFVVVGLIVVLTVVGLVWAFRSARRWKDVPPTDPEARQAFYRLWSKKGPGQF